MQREPELVSEPLMTTLDFETERVGCDLIDAMLVELYAPAP